MKYVADLHTELDTSPPPVMCVDGEFNQVILDLIVNAAHAIGDLAPWKLGEKGEIAVSTRRDGMIVQKHDGTISFDTAPGLGTTFRIGLPAAGTSDKNTMRRAGDSPTAALPQVPASS